MNLSLFFPAIYGLLIGGLLSYYYSIHSIKSASAYSLTIFGTDSTYLIKFMVIITAGFLVGVLAAFSALVRDLDYPTKNPIKFTIETIVAAFLPALFLLMMTYIRQKDFTVNSVLDFIVLLIKGALLHVLFQFSGLYSSVFS